MAKHLSEKVLYENKYFKIKSLEIEFSNGVKRNIEIMDKGDTAMIVPITSDGKIILIKEYFYAADKVMLSLPKGMVDEGYNDFETANKELQEEAGYKAGKLEKLGVLRISPGYITMKTHVYLAQDLSESKLEGDEDEEIEVYPYPFDKVDDLIVSSEISEARVIAAIYLAKKHLKLF